MSAPQGGLILCQQTRPNPDQSYYAKATEGVLTFPTLIAPVSILPSNESTTASIYVEGANGPYKGAIQLAPGANSTIPASQPDGLTLRAVAGGVSIEVGTDGQAVNTLSIAGADGLSQVNDPLYNPAVSLKAITMISTNPLCAPTPGNTGEIFRCAQAGVVASGTTAIGNTFNVPTTGWYSLQMEVKLENAAAPAVPDINVPITPAGSIDIGETLSFVITQGVVVEPYGAMECVSSEFLASSILVASGNVIRQYVSQHLFEAGTNYVFSLRSSSLLWNIGTNGQIKAELIAMI